MKEGALLSPGWGLEGCTSVGCTDEWAHSLYIQRASLRDGCTHVDVVEERRELAPVPPGEAAQEGGEEGEQASGPRRRTVRRRPV